MWTRFAAPGFMVALGTTMAWPAPAYTDEAGHLRGLIDDLRTEYETRIEQLEDKLERLETRADTTSPSPPGDGAQRTGSAYDSRTGGSGFNPSISLILDGNYYDDNIGGAGQELLGEAFRLSHPGHEHPGQEGHAHGGAEQGFNLREAELFLGATVDPYFDAAGYITLSEDGDVELEEAWFQTRSLPAGLQLKGGKFRSGIGYVNGQHPHQWDFVDQNLPYLNLLGFEGLTDKGLQLGWVPPVPVYTRLGLELLQGDQERFGAFVDDDEERDELGLSERDSAPRLLTAFVKVAPDLGFDHALQLGAWAAADDQHQEIHEEEEEGEVGLDGDALLWGVEAVYKHDSGAAYGKGDWQLQAEYLRERKKLTATAAEEMPSAIGTARNFTTDGLYLQGWYGFAPRWRAGLRYDVLGLTNKVSGGESGSFDESDRWSAALTWMPSEFSQFRLQYARASVLMADGMKEDFDYFFLQYVFSLGAHGAHEF